MIETSKFGLAENTWIAVYVVPSKTCSHRESRLCSGAYSPAATIPAQSRSVCRLPPFMRHDESEQAVGLEELEAAFYKHNIYVVVSLHPLILACPLAKLTFLRSPPTQFLHANVRGFPMMQFESRRSKPRKTRPNPRVSLVQSNALIRKCTFIIVARKEPAMELGCILVKLNLVDQAVPTSGYCCQAEGADGCHREGAACQ